MTGFAPLLFIGIIWLLIGLPISKAVKVARKDTPQPARKTFPAEAFVPEDQSDPQPGDTAPVPAREPYVGSPGNLSSGSLNYVSQEGVDICHTQQAHEMDVAEESGANAYDTPADALPFLNGNAVVQGFVMSEILNRKHK